MQMPAGEVERPPAPRPVVGPRDHVLGPGRRLALRGGGPQQGGHALEVWDEMQPPEPAVVHPERRDPATDWVIREGPELGHPVGPLGEALLPGGPGPPAGPVAEVLRVVHRLVELDQSGPGIDELLDLGRPVAGQDSVFLGPVEQEHDDLGPGQRLRLLRPVESNNRSQPGRLPEQVGEDGTPGDVLMLAWLVEVGPGDQDDLNTLGVGRQILDRRPGGRFGGDDGKGTEEGNEERSQGGLLSKHLAAGPFSPPVNTRGASAAPPTGGLERATAPGPGPALRPPWHHGGLNGAACRPAFTPSPAPRLAASAPRRSGPPCWPSSRAP